MLEGVRGLSNSVMMYALVHTLVQALGPSLPIMATKSMLQFCTVYFVLYCMAVYETSSLTIQHTSIYYPQGTKRACNWKAVAFVISLLLFHIDLLCISCTSTVLDLPIHVHNLEMLSITNFPITSHSSWTLSSNKGCV